MEIEELNFKFRELEKALDLEKNKIIIEYCDSKNQHQVGSVFTDHIGSIMIEKISYTKIFRVEDYACKYFGSELNKDGTPKKNGNKRTAYQEHEKK